MGAGKTVIIGAGLAGLSAAYHLKENYVLLEKEERVGGLCRSVNVDGFTFDHSIHILYSSDPYATQLIKDVLLKDNLLLQPRESYVYSKRVYTEYPFQAHTYGLPPQVVKECLLGLVHAKYEMGDAPQPANFEEWIYRTFGHGIADHFMVPYNRRQWAFDLKKMDYNWIAERVPVPDLDEVFNGALFPPEKKFGPNAEFWYPREGGIEALPRGFLPYVNDIRVQTEVTAIDPRKRSVLLAGGESLEYGHLVSTAPLPELVDMLSDAPDKIRAAARALESNTVYAINIMMDVPTLSDMHWVYFPEDDYVFHRISFMMNFASANAPTDSSSITVEVSQSDYKPQQPETLFGQVVDGLLRAGVLESAEQIRDHHTLKLNPAYVIYDLSHRANVDLILAYLEQQDIFSCGRFGEWEYLNMDHSILSGRRAAQKVLAK